MIKDIKIQEADANAWAVLAKESHVASWFQTYEGGCFFNGLSFLETFCLAVEREGQLKGVISGYIQKDGGRVKRFFSRRAIILGGPMLADDITDNELADLLIALKRKLKKRVIYVEMRNFNDYSRWGTVFETCGFDYEPHYDIWVDTCSLEVVNENMGKSRKRDVRVSQRDGALIVTEPTLQQIDTYYEILSDLYRNKIKKPLFPIEFFHKLYQSPDSVFLLVEYDGEIVGGTVCVGLQGKNLYEMYVCGMDGVHKNIFPSELATFAGLQYAATNGFRGFDMMGAGKPGDGGYGVRDFKLKFGGKLLEFGRNIYICNQMLYNIGKTAVKIITKK